MNYAVVTPARDEADNLPRLASSLMDQTATPTAWIVVENGSRDATWTTLERLRDSVPFLHPVSAQAGSAAYTGHVARALDAAIPLLEPIPDVLVSVDADVTFPPEYFESLLGRFAGDPELGIASGTCFEQEGDEWVERHVTGDHVWGAARAYRREVLNVVMPLEQRMGWDGIDQLKANIAGWTTATFKDLPFFHHRPEGRRKGRSFAFRTRQGETAYYMGYRASYLVLRATFLARKDVGAAGLVWGYCRSAITRQPRCPDPVVRDYLRETQRLRLTATRFREALGRR